jgi:hypothetical protein
MVTERQDNRHDDETVRKSNCSFEATLLKRTNEAPSRRKTTIPEYINQ